jgi:hypothetical protein
VEQVGAAAANLTAIHITQTGEGFDARIFFKFGEPPITAAVATIVNAIFNATGKRIKELQITPDKILQARQV